jgi:probable rRNA maturation factor
VEIGILIDKEFKRTLTAVWLRKVAGQVLLAEHVNPLVEIGLVITGQEKIRELNRLYLEEDAPTDVLSFPMTESDVDGNSFITPPDNALHLGEVVISYPQAKQQAKEHGHTVKKEVAVLIVHGVLHLLDYDHDTPGHRGVMRKREAVILKTIEEKLL